jgi:hypothetical protein
MALSGGVVLCGQDVPGSAAQVRVVTGGNFGFVSGKLVGGSPVKGAPYSAQGVTETVQTLADGNRIVQKSTATVYRDSEGRERREQTLPSIGPFTAQGAPPQMITISDPVAGVNYSLNAAEHIAVKLPSPSTLPFPPPPGPGANVNFDVMVKTPGVQMAPGAPASQVMFYSATSGPNGRTAPDVQQLGTKVIEGVAAEGTRTTITIPAGEMGNDRPIEIVDEQWRSPELQVTISSQHTDPRMGTTTYSLTNISRAEPSPTLFQVPPDYTIKEGPVMFERKLLQ